MDEQLAQEVGERVRFYRLAGRKTQPVIAGLAGITTDYLYQIERGKKAPTVQVVVALANALRVPAGALLGDAMPVERVGSSGPALGEALHRAMVMPAQTGHSAMRVADLCAQITEAWRTWQTCPTRYSRVTQVLPGLLGEVEALLRQEPSSDAQRCASDLYCLVRTVAKRSGRIDVAAMAADRACRAAEGSEDALRLGAARWNLAHAVLAEGQHELAEDIAVSAGQEIQPAGNAEAVAIHGSLMLVASVAAARKGDLWTARDRVRSVSSLAQKAGECNALWTAFGPTNVGMHAVSIEAEAGESSEAAHMAERVMYERSPSIERRVAFLLDEARSQHLARDYRSTLAFLQAAEAEAPEDVAFRPAAQGLVRSVIQRASRTTAKEAALMAGRLAIVPDATPAA